MAMHLQTGKQAEERAREHLERRGLRLLERNYRCRQGEIDLIMLQGDTLVFIEVRYRKSSAFGSAVETVTAQKQARLLAAARHYLQAKRASLPCRFDVVGITGQAPGAHIEWISDAF
ncbi:MAG: YraN family protein, partial [Chromatiales bacterium]